MFYTSFITTQNNLDRDVCFKFINWTYKHIRHDMVLWLWRTERASWAHITSPMSRCVEKTRRSLHDKKEIILHIKWKSSKIAFTYKKNKNHDLNSRVLKAVVSFKVVLTLPSCISVITIMPKLKKMCKFGPKNIWRLYRNICKKFKKLSLIKKYFNSKCF